MGNIFIAQIPNKPEKIGKHISKEIVADPVICELKGKKFHVDGSISVLGQSLVLFHTRFQQAVSEAANDFAGDIPTGIFFTFAK